MRLLQLTDLHIGREGEYTGGVDVRNNFLEVLALCRTLQADHLVISGDLCFDDGQDAIYHWVRTQIEALAIPYEIMSGNHDDPEMMAQCFDRTHLLTDGELYFTKIIKDYPILFLDTTTGIVSDQQLEWLTTQLQQYQRDLVLLMHHPPVLAGVPHMDNHYALKNMAAVQDVLLAHPYNLTIFTGHYHVEKTIRLKNLEVNITPSCYFQIDPTQESFSVDHYRIGLREIVLNGETLSHRVVYVK